MTYFLGNCRTEFHNSGLFALSFASSASKHICFSVFSINGGPYKLAVIIVVVTNIPIIVLSGSGGVVSIPLATLFGARRKGLLILERIDVKNSRTSRKSQDAGRRYA